jgi:mono/diheme cytochrome c family protein
MNHEFTRMNTNHFGSLTTLCFALGFAVATFAAAPAATAPALQLTAAQSAFFENKIRPVLTKNCYKCHSSESLKLKGGLLLDTRDGLLKGGDTGPTIVPGDPEKSLLIKAVRYTDADLQMPPKGDKLSDEQINDLVTWVKMGAPDPRVGSAVAKSPGKGKDHWSFQPVTKPAVPQVQDKGRAANEVEAGGEGHEALAAR